MTTYAPNNQANNHQRNEQDRSRSTNPLHEQRQALAKDITESCDHHGPENRTRQVVNEKYSPRHLARCACKQRGKDPQSGDESRDEDRLVAVTLEVLLHMLEPFRRQKKETADAQQEWAAKVMTNRKTYVVTNDSASSGRRHNANQVELIRMSGGEISTDEQNCFAGHRQPRVFQHHSK